MRLLIKFPTRSRPTKFLEVLKKYVIGSHDMSKTQIIVSIDEDDKTMTNDVITRAQSFHGNIRVIKGPSSGKVGAINRDMPDPSEFDILLLASDDMVPYVNGYDRIIRDSMEQMYPDTDGVLFFNDGYSGRRLNTLVICGSKYYSRFGYIYHPEYKSLFCDNEFMDEANRLGKQTYYDQPIIKHEHYTHTRAKPDALYNVNEALYSDDEEVYRRRKKMLGDIPVRNPLEENAKIDVSVMICTLPGRRAMFDALLEDIENFKNLTSLNVEVLTDATVGITTGEKRNLLVARAKGTYCCFVDDDDKITPQYFKLIEDAIRSGNDYDSVSFNGRYYVNFCFDKPFYHALKYDDWSQGEKGYYRPPNHLNPIKTVIAKQVPFKDVSDGEDRAFSDSLLDLKLIKTEYNHNKVQYLYYKKWVDPDQQSSPASVAQRSIVRWGIRR